MKGKFLSVLFLLSLALGLKAQDGTNIDKIIAIVGDKIVLSSEVDVQYMQYTDGKGGDESLKCEILEQLILQKLLVHQAAIDSVIVTDEEIEAELDQKMNYFISLFGSQKKMEEYYNKTVPELKQELRDDVEDQQLGRRMQANITSGTSVTPAEVRSFFKSIPEDSIPMIEASIQLGEIVFKPEVSLEKRQATRKKLLDLRKRIVDGTDDFSVLATLYSEDPGSAANGGELGFVGRGSYVPEFEAAAYKLTKGQVSEIIETQYGFHILELIDRRADEINIRHILVKPELTNYDFQKAKEQAKLIRSLVITDSITWTQGVDKYSTDEQSKNGGGLLTNPQTGETTFSKSELENVYKNVTDTMETGQISNPFVYVAPDGSQTYKIIYVVKMSDTHKANLDQDYNRIKAIAQSMKEQEAMEKWKEMNVPNTYIYIEEDYKNCPKINTWTQ